MSITIGSFTAAGSVTTTTDTGSVDLKVDQKVEQY
jgi:hypothetical protein